MKILIRRAVVNDILIINQYIYLYSLDGENIDYKNFFVAEKNKKIIGFARIKNYKEFKELATFGIISEYRNKGIGKKLIREIIKLSDFKIIWITTVIPDFFAKLGFIASTEPPDELKNKCLRICLEQNKSVDNSYFLYFQKNLDDF